MKSFFGCIAIATEAENGKIRVQNAKFAGKRITKDEFIYLYFKSKLGYLYFKLGNKESCTKVVFIIFGHYNVGGGDSAKEHVTLSFEFNGHGFLFK